MPRQRIDAVDQAAVVVELLHVGSLHHDDVMDKATSRRGVPTANTLWGDRAATLVGSYLLATAAELSTDLGLDIPRRLAQTLTRLVEGLLHEAMGPRQGEEPISHYLGVISAKSASLVAMATQLGAVVAGAPDHVTSALATYGHELDSAFQISDDVLDIVADSSVSGKSSGTDLREGVRTLPVLYTLAGRDPDAIRLRELLANGPVPDGPILDEAVEILRRSPGTIWAYRDVHLHTGHARQALRALPDLPARQALAGLCDFVAKRQA